MHRRKGIHGKVTDPSLTLHTFEGPNGSSPLDRVLARPNTWQLPKSTLWSLLTGGHYQLTAKFIIRPSVKNDMKDPVHQTIPSNIFCPGRTEADPYTPPHDLQELIRRVQSAKIEIPWRDWICSYFLVMVEATAHTIASPTSTRTRAPQKIPQKTRRNLTHPDQAVSGTSWSCVSYF